MSQCYNSTGQLKLVKLQVAVEKYCELKKDCGIMNNLAFSDEVYPEGIVTFEENLKVILTSKTYKHFKELKMKKYRNHPRMR